MCVCGGVAGDCYDLALRSTFLSRDSSFDLGAGTGRRMHDAIKRYSYIMSA